MTRELLKEFIKQYGKGWYIGETDSELKELFALFDFSLGIVPIETVGERPEIDCISLFTKESSYMNFIEKKGISVGHRNESNELDFGILYKYSNGVEMYRMMIWGFSELSRPKWINDFNYLSSEICPMLYSQITTLGAIYFLNYNFDEEDKWSGILNRIKKHN